MKTKVSLTKPQVWFKVAAVVALGSFAWKKFHNLATSRAVAAAFLRFQETSAIYYYLDSKESMAEEMVILMEESGFE